MSAPPDDDPAPEQAPAAPPEARVVKPRPSALGRLAARIQRYELAIVAALSLAVLLPGLWSFQLIDPWETHYSEVGRRILEDDDWVHLKWQNEVFRSKPILTFWLIAGSMETMGVATDGGYSGELAVSDLAVFAARLPFTLFGAFGLVMLWWMLASLVNRRVAWIAFGITLTCPIYMLVSRQAITDMPMVASLMGAVALFAMHVHKGKEPLVPWWRRVNAHHLFLACLALFVLSQAVYYIVYFHFSPGVARGLKLSQPGWVLGGGTIAVFGGLVAWMVVHPVRTRGAVWLHWAFFLFAVAALAKGPVILLVLAIAGLYILLTASWRLLLDWEWLRGAVVAALVMVPWHLAMFFKDGQAWVNEYFEYHMGKRLAEGAHQQDAKTTFDYFSSVLGVGMWPWAVLIPVALVSILWTANNRTREGQVRLLCGIWAIAGFALFAFSQTKFHHYILPVVPALAILVAFWIDDALEGRGGRVALYALFAAALSASRSSSSRCSSTATTARGRAASRGTSTSARSCSCSGSSPPRRWSRSRCRRAGCGRGHSARSGRSRSSTPCGRPTATCRRRRRTGASASSTGSTWRCAPSMGSRSSTGACATWPTSGRITATNTGSRASSPTGSAPACR